MTKVNNKNTLKCAHVNTQSLPAHFAEFEKYFGSGRYDIIAISETWLIKHILDNAVALPGYSLGLEKAEEVWDCMFALTCPSL